MKTATIIFRTTPEKKLLLQQQFGTSKAAARAAYENDRGGSRSWERYRNHPNNLGQWVEQCALVESAARTKNLKALAGKVKK